MNYFTTTLTVANLSAGVGLQEPSSSDDGIAMSVVYKKAYDTSRGGRTIHHTPHHVQYPIHVAFLRKDARRKK